MQLAAGNSLHVPVVTSVFLQYTNVTEKRIVMMAQMNTIAQFVSQLIKYFGQGSLCAPFRVLLFLLQSYRIKSKFLLAGCSSKELACASGDECFPAVYKCDGDKDCDDGSDEHNCPIGKLIDYSMKSQSCGSFQMWKVFRFYFVFD